LAIGLARQGHSIRIFASQNDPNRLAREEVALTEVFFGSLDDAALLNAALRDVEVIVHLACSMIPQLSNESPATDVMENLVGSIRLLAAAKNAGVRKIVFASSGGTIYGPTESTLLTEDHPTNPICSYGITKLAIEKYLALYYHLYGLEYVVLRLANPFGEYQNPNRGQGAIAVFINRVLKRQPIQIWGDGSVARDYFYIGDAVRAFSYVVERETRSRIYNIGSGIPRTINEILIVIGNETGITPNIEYESPRMVDIPINFLDIARAGRELSWSATTPFEVGIRQAIAWQQKP